MVRAASLQAASVAEEKGFEETAQLVKEWVEAHPAPEPEPEAAPEPEPEPEADAEPEGPKEPEFRLRIAGPKGSKALDKSDAVYF
eukprot:COSAG04_NODE_3861_length_2465_cov_1.622147_4_plen_84_part_01